VAGFIDPGFRIRSQERHRLPIEFDRFRLFRFALFEATLHEGFSRFQAGKRESAAVKRALRGGIHDRLARQ
jgi:hypothetical protein